MILIRGARQHNLKGIDVNIPDEKLVVITGVSGSGKSSLAFDTIYAEGQRRYVETFSAYARQFLEQMEKPQVDLIEGLSPAIAIDQQGGTANPRSTVGTVTECYDYLRLLFARAAVPNCPSCKIPIEAKSPEDIFRSIKALSYGTKIQLFAPLVKAKKGEYRELLEDLSREGFSKVRVDGEIIDLSEPIKLERYKVHNIEVLIDRLIVKDGMDERLFSSLGFALEKGEGSVIVHIPGKDETLFSKHMSCPKCNFSLDQISPAMFSFNSPLGACKTCDGTGIKKKIDLSLIVSDYSLSIYDGAIPALISRSRVFMSLLKKLENFAKIAGIDLNAPLSSLGSQKLNLIFYGSDKEIELTYNTSIKKEKFRFKSRFEGLIKYIEDIYQDKSSDELHKDIEEYMISIPCEACKGMRLNNVSLSVTIEGRSIGELCHMDIKNLKLFLSTLIFTGEKAYIGGVILKEIISRLNFLLNLGIGYLTLERTVSTLSGGELQRIRLGTQIGSGLSGVLYILDEPTVGLHQRDNRKLLDTLKSIRDMGNSIIVVEHDEQTIREGDYILDLGPGAGSSGGDVVACGTVEDIISNHLSLTGKYLHCRNSENIASRKLPDEKFIKLYGAGEHNLKNIDVSFPLGLFICVTGVSGSGKVTLVNDILYRVIASKINRSRLKPGLYSSVSGIEQIDKVIMIDQGPIGRTPRSNPASFTGLFTFIRDIFALTPQARLRGYKKGRFSFNTKGGRCEKCLGSGVINIEMHFLPNLYVTCEECGGKRYNSETLSVEFKGKNISQVLEMTVSEGLDFFSDFPKITRILHTLNKVGLGYIQLGQSANLLSGGEAQRIKLASELSRKSTGKTLYIMDEPTTGLHFHDVKQLLLILHELRNQNNTIIVIEHNMDMIRAADYIIDLGPEGGDEGGYLIDAGPPEKIADNELSYTGQFLKHLI